MSITQVETLGTARCLEEKIRSRQAKVGIAGLGYVGLPLAVEFAKAGFDVTGIDLSDSKVERINAGDSYVGDIANTTLGPLVKSGKLKATTDFSVDSRSGHGEHLRSHAAAQDQGPGHELHRVGMRRNCQVFPRRDAGHSGIHYLPGNDR